MFKVLFYNWRPWRLAMEVCVLLAVYLAVNSHGILQEEWDALYHTLTMHSHVALVLFDVKVVGFRPENHGPHSYVQVTEDEWAGYICLATLTFWSNAFLVYDASERASGSWTDENVVKLSASLVLTGLTMVRCVGLWMAGRRRAKGPAASMAGVAGVEEEEENYPQALTASKWASRPHALSSTSGSDDGDGSGSGYDSDSITTLRMRRGTHPMPHQRKGRPQLV
jgi:hypothetical protein